MLLVVGEAKHSTKVVVIVPQTSCKLLQAPVKIVY